MKTQQWFAQISRALLHNGALTDDEAMECPSLRAANALMRAKGIAYNDALSESAKYLSGIEGWTDIADPYGRSSSAVEHTTATGRLKIIVSRDRVELLFSAGSPDSSGNNTVARISIYEDDGLRVYPHYASAELLADRPDRIALLLDIDATGELMVGLTRLAEAMPPKSGTKEARIIVAAMSFANAT